MPDRYDVDLVLLRRDASSPADAILQSLRAQRGVRPRLHRIVGNPHPQDPNRWATIARARNKASRLGNSRFLMFLDDDVILHPDCVARLAHGLQARPGYAALAADYIGETDPRSSEILPTRHVAMGATLFRREVVAFLRFRWEAQKCECQCCCDDLRKAGFGIGYLPGASARHASQPNRDRNHATRYAYMNYK